MIKQIIVKINKIFLLLIFILLISLFACEKLSIYGIPSQTEVIASTNICEHKYNKIEGTGICIECGFECKHETGYEGVASRQYHECKACGKLLEKSTQVTKDSSTNFYRDKFLSHDDASIEYTINQDAKITKTGTDIPEIRLTNEQLFYYSYIMGNTSNDLWQKQYAILKKDHNIDISGVLEKLIIKENKISDDEKQSTERLCQEAEAYYDYVKKGAQVILNAHEAGDINNNGNYYFGPIYITYFKGRANNQDLFKPTFKYIKININDTVMTRDKLYYKDGQEFNIKHINEIDSKIGYYIYTGDTPISKNNVKITLKYQDIYKCKITSKIEGNNCSLQIDPIDSKDSISQPEKTIESNLYSVGNLSLISIDLNTIDDNGINIDNGTYKMYAFQYVNGTTYGLNDVSSYVNAGSIQAGITDNDHYEISINTPITPITINNSKKTVIVLPQSRKDPVYVILIQTGSKSGYKKEEKPILLGYGISQNNPNYWDSNNGPALGTIGSCKTENWQTNNNWLGWLNNESEQNAVIETTYKIFKNSGIITNTNTNPTPQVQYEKLNSVWPNWEYSNDYGIGENGFGKDEFAWVAPHTFGKKNSNDTFEPFTYDVVHSNEGIITSMTYRIKNKEDIPDIKINLDKFDLLGNILHNAKFKISAKQGGTNLYELEQNDNKYEFTITPRSKEDVYVLLRETEAPTGYEKINNVNLIFSYNDGKWNLKISDAITWFESGFESNSDSIASYITFISERLSSQDPNLKEFLTKPTSWNSWTSQNDDNEYLSKKNDKIIINYSYDNKCFEIKIYDLKETSNKITLLKVDKKDTKKKLGGAQFSGSISNIISFKYGQETITVDNDNHIYNFKNLEVTDGELSITNIRLANNSKQIEIILTEITPPDGYIGNCSNVTIKTQFGKNNVLTINREDYVEASMSNDHELEIKVKNAKIPEINIEINKYGTSDKLSGAKFAVSAKQDNNTVHDNEIITTTNEENEKITICPKTINDVTVEIKEEVAPDCYKKLEKPIQISFKLNDNKTNWVATVNEPWKKGNLEEYIYQNDKIEFSQIKGTKLTENYYCLKVYDRLVIDKIVLLKRDLDTEASLEGVKFTGTISNVLNNSQFDATTAQNGEIVIKNLIVDDPNSTIIIKINEIKTLDNYKKIDEPIIIEFEYTEEKGFDKTEDVIINNIGKIDISVSNRNQIQITIPNKRVINLSGKVWLDGQTGIKPAVSPNGKIDAGEKPVSEVKVTLWKNENNKLVQVTKDGYNNDIPNIQTNTVGEYEFSNIDYGSKYVIKFEYDGVNYEPTLKGEDSWAKEISGDRDYINKAFHTINKDTTVKHTITKMGKSIQVSKKLTYESRLNDKTQIYESILQTLSRNNTAGKLYPYEYTDEKTNKMYLAMGNVITGFSIKAQTENYQKSDRNVNLGLVKRGTDLALSIDVDHTEVSINGYNTKYNYNKETETYKNPSYVQNIYNSDYKYESPDGTEDLEVYAVFKVTLKNQSTKTATINSINCKYNADLLTYDNYDNETGIVTKNISINCELDGGESKDILLTFEVKKNGNNINLGDFEVIAEIAEYSTAEGLIDCDSAPRNFNGNDFEDDTDNASIKLQPSEDRQISGTVFEDKDSDSKKSGEDQGVDGVLVQLVELKQNDNSITERIADSKTTENGGKYCFTGFIPGNYIVRFTYGDKAIDNTKYNGQDYKSTYDNHYNSEWYNTCIGEYEYTASVARDNEARRLQTMAWSTKVDGEKGILLKLLDVQDVENLNATEKDLIKKTYKTCYGADIPEVNNETLEKLLKEQTLLNTYMQAETSKISIPVDTIDQTSTAREREVDGTNKAQYKNEFNNINLGLQKRPQTRIKLKKYITGMNLVANNGQTLVNAIANVDSYYNEEERIRYEQISGIKENLSVRGTYWSYEVNPTKINTVVEGSTLKFQYTVVVENASDTDYLSKTLIDDYNNESIDEYIGQLENYAEEANKKNIGKYLGQHYYTGVKAESDKEVQLEVTGIRDYISNNLLFASSLDNNKVELTTDKIWHNILNSDYSFKKIKLDSTLDVKKPTGKMKIDNKEIFSINLATKKVISTSGTKDFYNYIAEVMSYTNAAGRRADSTPANADFISESIENNPYRQHEKDEADTGKIQIGVETGM